MESSAAGDTAVFPSYVIEGQGRVMAPDGRGVCSQNGGHVFVFDWTSPYPLPLRWNTVSSVTVFTTRPSAALPLSMHVSEIHSLILHTIRLQRDQMEAFAGCGVLKSLLFVACEAAEDAMAAFTNRAVQKLTLNFVNTRGTICLKRENFPSLRRLTLDYTRGFAEGSEFYHPQPAEWGVRDLCRRRLDDFHFYVPESALELVNQPHFWPEHTRRARLHVLPTGLQQVGTPRDIYCDAEATRLRDLRESVYNNTAGTWWRFFPCPSPAAVSAFVERAAAVAHGHEVVLLGALPAMFGLTPEWGVARPTLPPGVLFTRTPDPEYHWAPARATCGVKSAGATEKRCAQCARVGVHGDA